MAVDLVFSETGDGPPAVILHGLFGSKRNWASIATALGRSHRVLSVDLRNHGESPWDDRHDYPAMADDVALLIRSVVGGAAAVVGHSMGGKVAMTLALDTPALVARLVVVDIAPAVSRATSIDLVHAMQSTPLAGCVRRSDVVAALGGRISDPAIRSFLAQSVTIGPDGPAWSVNLDAIERNFDSILGFPVSPAARSFHGPACFVAGGRSSYLQQHHWPEIERLFPAATLEVIPEAGHWVHADAPERFLALVERFFAA